MNHEKSEKIIQCAKGTIKADVVFKNTKIINTFTNEIEEGDLAVQDGLIVGVGNYSGEKEIDLHGKYICSGFIDGHIHIESSMMCGPAFEKAVLPHGTTAVITDPHEICNVAGEEGLQFMLDTTEQLKLSVYFMLPSCVPATNLDESGAVLTADKLQKYYKNPRILGLAEMMNFYGTVNGEKEILAKIEDCHISGKIVDGHAPFLTGNLLNAYIAAGVCSDHECSNIDEAMEKLRRGQYIMVREGTAAKNLQALLPLFQEPYCERCMIVSDDRHPDDLLQYGHIDGNIRKAIKNGADPIIAIKMATLIPAQYFGLKKHGVIMPGYIADFIVLSDLHDLHVEQVYKNGKLVAKDGKVIEAAQIKINENRYPHVMHSFNMNEIQLGDFQLKNHGTHERVIDLVTKELLTNERIVPLCKNKGTALGVDIDQNIVKIAVFERHHHTGHVGLGFLGNYGLKCGAVASSIGHDSHNLIIAGTNDEERVIAGKKVRKNEGGLAFVANGKVIGELALPVAGLMSLENAEELVEKMRDMKNALKLSGISEDIDAFMTLAFISLPVIPKLRLNTYGIIDVDQQKVVPAIF